MTAITVTSGRLDTIAAAVNVEHAEIETALRNSLIRAVRAGELLAEAKSLVKHGEWLPWLAEHCTFSERTAQNYMRIAVKFPELAKAQSVADLTYHDAIALLAEPRQETANLVRAQDSPPDVVEPGDPVWFARIVWCNQEAAQIVG